MKHASKLHKVKQINDFLPRIFLIQIKPKRTMVNITYFCKKAVAMQN